MKKLAIIVALVALAACSDSEGAAKTLAQAGYTDIQTTGHSWFGCGRDDNVSTGFKAKGPTGIPVTGVICKSVGLFGKSSTIRLD